MTHRLLVSGGGISGLAAAVAGSRAGWAVNVFEQASDFAEAGAGIQLGPNATRILRQWGALSDLFFAPDYLTVCNASSGARLAQLPLGSDFEQRYGAPYLTAHRADLHQALLNSAENAGARINKDVCVSSAQQFPGHVRLCADRFNAEGEALVVADGLWSVLRAELLQDGPPVLTGDLAYRALVQQNGLPADLRSTGITVWLGPQMHVVTYPVRGGDLLNVVCIVEGSMGTDARGWSHPALASQLKNALGSTCRRLQALVDATDAWKLWALHDRPPLRYSSELVAGRIALSGDAAHPMLPYLAQGAAMGLEDAHVLGQQLEKFGDDASFALQMYAAERLDRCARVQRRAKRNGEVFHADGVMRWGRDTSLTLLGARLLDMPWLYGATSGAA